MLAKVRGRSSSPPDNPHRLKGMRVLITAGPTREFFDPVRFLSNPSTGKMGYALAEAAFRSGASVTLVSGPVALKSPPGVRVVPVVTALEMRKAVLREFSRSQIVIMTAAVSDFRPKTYSTHKVKKKNARLTFALVPNPDILQEIGTRKKPGQILTGFAAETRSLLKNARKKMDAKNLDYIVVNRVGSTRSGFAGDRNSAWILSRRGMAKKFPDMSKKKMAALILKEIRHRR